MKKQWITLQTLLLCVFVFAACENSSLHPVMGLLGEQNMEKQVFTITAQKDTVLIGGQGTEIGIPAEAFVDLNGQPVVGAVELELKECLSPLDMVLGNLTTLSNGKALESGGMIYLNAMADGEQVRLADGIALDVQMPCDSVRNGMQLYEGLPSEDGINWQNPVPLSEAVPEAGLVGEEDVIDIVGDVQRVLIEEIRSNVGYSIKERDYAGSFHRPEALLEKDKKAVSKEFESKINDLIWADGGLRISKDSIVFIEGREVTLIKSDSDVVSRTWKIVVGETKRRIGMRR